MNHVEVPTTDPFLMVANIRAAADIRSFAPAASRRQCAEVMRLVAAGDVFGAGLVLAMAIGQPLVDPAALTA